MKWFKHLAGSLNDSFVFELVERFGGDGYMVFFGTLELMSDEFDIENPGKCQLSIKKLTKNLQLSRQKTIKILKYCDEKRRIFCNINEKHIDLFCPRLKELTDEYTQKKVKELSGQTPDSSRDKLRPKEAEVEAEVTTLKSSSQQRVVDPCPHQEIVNLYHEVLPELRGVKVWNNERQRNLRARWRENTKRQNLNYWKRLFLYIKESDFLMGKTEKPFSCDLGWVVNSSNFVKIIEGKYHGGRYYERGSA